MEKFTAERSTWWWNFLTYLAKWRIAMVKVYIIYIYIYIYIYMFSCNNVRIPPANGEIIKLPVWILPRICKGSASMEAAFYALIATGFDLSWRYKSSVSGSRISVTTGVEEPHQSLCGDDGNWLGNWLGTSALRDNQTRKLWFFYGL